MEIPLILGEEGGGDWVMVWILELGGTLFLWRLLREKVLQTSWADQMIAIALRRMRTSVIVPAVDIFS